MMGGLCLRCGLVLLGASTSPSLFAQPVRVGSKADTLGRAEGAAAGTPAKGGSP